MVGKTLGHYRILEKIGAGGMGEVYRAHDEQLDRDVVLKILPPSSFTDASARARLLREARSAAGLNHPHICTIHEVGEADGQAYIAMEYVEGLSLSARLAGGPLPAGEVLRYGLQLAEALGHAHERGIVHRDLKSANVVITAEGRAKVLDFGLAKRLSGEELAGATTQSQASLTRSGAVMGTLPYMAPEQLRGQGVDARSDIWALGVVLYEMAAGRRPFRGDTGYDLSAAILREPPPALPTQVPVELRAVIERCLAKEPERRYQRASEARAALEAIQSGAVSPWLRWKYRLARRGFLALTAATALALVTLLVGLNVGGLRTRLLGGASAPRIESLAVLPLANLSGDPEQEYFADGIHEALITDLARLSGLKRVIARTSVMRYKETNKPLQEIAQDLKVDAVVTGSVVRTGDRVRVTAQLINPRSEEHLWAERYERDLGDVLTMQNEIVSSIASQIELKLTSAEAAHLARARPVKPEAYESYLRGRFYLDKRTPESLRKGLEYFQAATDADPGYALGYVGLADTYRAFGSYGAMPPTEAYPRAKAALSKGLEIDDTLAEAHVSLATSHYDDFDWQAAERQFQRALELNPNYATAHHQHAVYLGASGRHEDAIKEIKRALELDPLSPVIRGAHVGILFHARKYDETIKEGEQAVDLKPPFIYFHVGAAYIEKGMFDKGVAQFEQEAAVSPTPAVKARLGYAYGRAGRRVEGVRIVRELEELSKRQYVPSYEIALAHAGLGNKAESLAWLERAYENREGLMWLHFLKVSPCFDGLRDGPRFQALLRRMNFPP